MSDAIREHWQYVFRLAHRCGHSRVDAEDLAQDVLERWARAAPRLPPTTNPRAWMTVVLRHLAVDRLRRRQVSRKVADAVRRLPADDHGRPPWWLELDTADVARSLVELTRAQRTAFERFVLEGKSYAQIASELRIATATVGVRVLRARRRLKQLLSARHGKAGLEVERSADRRERTSRGALR